MNRAILRRPTMIRISLGYIYTLSSRLDVLERIPKADTKLMDIFSDLLSAQGAVMELNNGLYAPYLRASFSYRQSLLAAISSMFEPHYDFEKDILAHQIVFLQNQYTQCKTSLLGELAVMDAYFVTQKGGFDTVSLLAWGEHLFPSDLAAKV